MEIKLNITSEQKANPFYERVIYPISGDKDFKVTITPLKTLESTKYATRGSAVGLDLERILKEHVIAIEGLEISFKDGDVFKVKSVDDLLSLPMNIEIDGLLMKIFNAILSDGELTEDEEKN